MGSDLTGKVVVPVIENGDGYAAQLFGSTERAGTPEELDAIEHRIRANGMYPHRMTPAEVERVYGLRGEEKEEWFAGVMQEIFARWLALADDRLDDPQVRVS